MVLVLNFMYYWLVNFLIWIKIVFERLILIVRRVISKYYNGTLRFEIVSFIWVILCRVGVIEFSKNLENVSFMEIKDFFFLRLYRLMF